MRAMAVSLPLRPASLRPALPGFKGAGSPLPAPQDGRRAEGEAYGQGYAGYSLRCSNPFVEAREERPTIYGSHGRPIEAGLKRKDQRRNRLKLTAICEARVNAALTDKKETSARP